MRTTTGYSGARTWSSIGSPSRNLLVPLWRRRPSSRSPVLPADFIRPSATSERQTGGGTMSTAISLRPAGKYCAASCSNLAFCAASGTTPVMTAASSAPDWPCSSAQSNRERASFSARSGGFAADGLGGAAASTGGADAGWDGGCTPVNAGNCSVQGKVGNGQPGHPPDFPAGGGGCAGVAAAVVSVLAAAAVSVLSAVSAAPQAEARLSPSACCSGVATKSSSFLKRTARLPQTP